MYGEDYIMCCSSIEHLNIIFTNIYDFVSGSLRLYAVNLDGWVLLPSTKTSIKYSKYKNIEVWWYVSIFF